MYIIKKDPNHTDSNPYINVEALEYFQFSGGINLGEVQESINRIGEWLFWDVLAKAHFFKSAHEAIAVAKKLNRPTTIYLYSETTNIAEAVWDWKHWIKSQ